MSVMELTTHNHNRDTIAEQLAQMLFEQFKKLSQQKAAPLVVCQEDNTASGAASY